MSRLYLVPVLVVACTAAASAQTIVVKPADRPSMPEQVRVTVGVNVFVPAPDDAGDQSLKAQEDARRRVYELAGHECAILHEVLSGDCTLESVNVNMQRVGPNQNWNQQRIEGFNLNANIGLRIVQK
jgi:hypothetical protein